MEAQGPLYVWKYAYAPMPIPHPCQARPLWVYFANKEKVESCPGHFSGRLLGLYCSRLLTVQFYSGIISYLHRIAIQSPELMSWFGHHVFVARNDYRTVGNIGLLHLPLGVKGWIHSLLHIWLSQCEHTKGICNPLHPVYCLLPFMHSVGKFVSMFVPPPSPQADLLNWLAFTVPSRETRLIQDEAWKQQCEKLGSWDKCRRAPQAHPYLSAKSRALLTCEPTYTANIHVWLSPGPILSDLNALCPHRYLNLFTKS